MTQDYAPTLDDKEVEKFYDFIESTIVEVSKKEIIIVQGDWNAKVSLGAHENWERTVGRYGIWETNDRGLRLLEFARIHRLNLAITIHSHKLPRTTTWDSPNGQVHNQKDFVLVPQRFKSSFNKAKTRTISGTYIGSDHDLVMTAFELKLKLKAKRCLNRSRVRFDLEKLKDPEIAEVFSPCLTAKWTLKESIPTSAKEVL